MSWFNFGDFHIYICVNFRSTPLINFVDFYLDTFKCLFNTNERHQHFNKQLR